MSRFRLVLLLLTVRRLVHQVSDGFRHWYNKHRALQNGFGDLINYGLQLHEMGQLHFVKEATPAGKDDFCPGVFYDIGYFSPGHDTKVGQTVVISLQFSCDD